MTRSRLIVLAVVLGTGILVTLELLITSNADLFMLLWLAGSIVVPAVLFTALVWAFVWMVRTRAARKNGWRFSRCTNCGYDMRGLVKVRVCPECGEVRR